MSESCVLAVCGTPGVGKTFVCQALAKKGWRVLNLAELAQDLGCLGEQDEHDGASPIDIHALGEKWEAPKEGLWVVDGHLSHFMEVDGLVLLRCHPSILSERLAQRGYPAEKIQANCEWELVAGHWAELLEFEVEIPLLELDAGVMDVEEMVEEITTWVEDGIASEELTELALNAIDWLNQADS